MRPNFIKTIILIGLLVFLISGCRKKNQPPYTPYTPNGPTSGLINITYQFYSLAFDPEGDSISIRFDFGKGDTSDWSQLVATEKTVEISFSWSIPDTYYVRAQAKDKNENISEWSLPHRVIITPNRPPNIPSVPFGPLTGYAGLYYQFSSLTTDLDEDKVSIRFDWGDGEISDWSGWVSSGDSVKMWHSWLYPDTFYVKAQAKDEFGAVSDWSTSSYITIDIKGLVWFLATDSAGWSPREGHATVIFDDKMWVLGGFDGSQSNEVWNSPDGFNWTCVTNSAYFVGDGTKAVVFDNKIWVIGGCEDVGFRNDVWCSSDGVNWTQVTDSAQWSPRAEHSVEVFNNKIWMLGGTGSPTGNDVWYSTDGVYWICATNSAEWEPRTEPPTVVFDNKIWIMGGETESYGLNDVWYSSNGCDWHRATNSAAWQGRHDHAAVVFDNKMWVLGGMVNSVGEPDESNDVWFSTDGNSWICDCPLTKFSPREGHSAVVFDNKIWVIGGVKDDVFFKNDVWYRTIIEKK